RAHWLAQPNSRRRRGGGGAAFGVRCVRKPSTSAWVEFENHISPTIRERRVPTARTTTLELAGATVLTFPVAQIHHTNRYTWWRSRTHGDHPAGTWNCSSRQHLFPAGS